MSWLSDLFHWWSGRRVPSGPAQPPRPTTPPPTIPIPRPTTPRPTGGTAGDDLTAIRAQLLDLHNAQRRRYNIRPFDPNTPLDACAQRYAGLMAGRGILDHSIDGTSAGARVAACGYLWSRIGENIAAGQRSPWEVVTAWMNSTGHRQNILGPCRDVGFGLAYDQHGQAFWCVDFGTRQGQGLTDYVREIAGFLADAVWEPPGIDKRKTKD
jgi:uncharacterized protein YkwD